MAGMHNMLLGLQAGTGGGGGIISTVDMVDPFGDGSGMALYQFNGNVLDLSGNYNGIATNITYDTGVFGQSVKCLGVGKVDLGLFHFNTPKSISFFAKGTFRLANDRNGILAPTFRIANNIAGMYSTSTSFNLTLTEDFTNFRHVVVTISYPEFKIYVDGVLKYTKAMTFNVPASTYSFGAFDIGNYSDSYSGNIDQLRLFNRALTAAEIAILYTETIAA